MKTRKTRRTKPAPYVPITEEDTGDRPPAPPGYDLDPSCIAPDGIATSRSITDKIPVLLLVCIAQALLCLATGCAIAEVPPVTRADHIAACQAACDTATQTCASPLGSCRADCETRVDLVAQGCLDQSAAWYWCAADPAALKCLGDYADKSACQWELEEYAACREADRGGR